MSILGFLRNSEWDKMDAVQYYRTYLPLREINTHNPSSDIKCIGSDAISGMTDDQLGGRDIYTMCRMYVAEKCQEFVDEIHNRGGLMVLDTDDDLTETYRLVSGRGEEFKEVLSIIDYLTVSTQPLATLLSQYTCRPPVVLKNHVDTAWMQKVAEKSRRIVDDGLTIGFSGSPTHWGDWYIPSVPFARIGRDYPDVTLMLHGETPRYLMHSGTDTIVKLGGVPFSIYPILLRQFDILLCAVDNQDRFNDGKSGVKALECMALGAVPICSNFRPYLELAAAGAPVVIINDDSRDGWYEAMRKVITDDDFRNDLSSRGPEWVKTNRDMCNTGYLQWEEFYQSILE